MLQDTGNGKYYYNMARIMKKNACKYDPGPADINVNRREEVARKSDTKMN